MFRWINYRFRLWRLRRLLDGLRPDTNKKVRAARASKKDQETIRKIYHDEHFDFTELRDDVFRLQTDYILRCASDLFIDTAIDINTDYIESNTGRSYLNLAAMNRINQSIRKERIERRQEWLIFAPAISGITGLLGAAIGFLSLFYNR